MAWQINSLPCRELLISSVDVITDNIVRIETKLMRSNGAYVDLFINVNTQNTVNPHSIILSDFGTTWDYLVDLGKPISQSSLEYVAESYGLQLEGHALSQASTVRNFLPDLLTLAQACVAISAPGFFEHTRMVRVKRERALVPTTHLGPSTFRIVIETLVQSRRSFDQAASIRLREAYEVRIDILVKMPARDAALMVVEHSPYEKVIMRRADHAFAIHTDLKEADWRGARFAIVDELDFQRERHTDSFIRLGRISRLISTSVFQKEGLD